jgi:hypothetical protein
LGVLFVSIAPNTQGNDTAKREKFECRAIVLGQSQTTSGQVAFLKRATTICNTLFGPEMKQAGGSKVGNLHWCSGLQIKWVPSITQETGAKTGLFKQKVPKMQGWS